MQQHTLSLSAVGSHGVGGLVHDQLQMWILPMARVNQGHRNSIPRGQAEVVKVSRANPAQGHDGTDRPTRDRKSTVCGVNPGKDDAVIVRMDGKGVRPLLAWIGLVLGMRPS